MNPRTETLAFKIWAHCRPLGWNCTVNEIAKALDESPKRIGAVLRHKGWAGRLRVSEHQIARDRWGGGRYTPNVIVGGVLSLDEALS